MRAGSRRRAWLLLLPTVACGGGDSRAGGGAGVVDSVGIAMRDPASWPTMTFVPTGTEIDSIPVGRIDSTWTLASPLAENMLPPHDSTSPFALGHSVGFQFDGDFNGDGVPDRARVGVYRDRDGSEGSFLLILSRRDSTHWSPAFVATEPGEPSFSLLVNDKSGLIWAECLSCGQWRPVFWSEGQWTLGPPAESGSSQ